MYRNNQAPFYIKQGIVDPMNLWRKKDIHQLLKESHDKPLKRVLGPFSLVALGVGAIIGAGLFTITGIAAAQYAGPAIILSFLISAIGCGFAGLCYSELASMLPVAGSAYTFTYVTMGELIAWAIGWDLILEYAIGAATVSISWSAYVVSLLKKLNIFLPPALIASPWQSIRLDDGTEAYGTINLPAVFIIGFLSLVLIRGVKESSLFNNLMVVIKLSVIVIFIGIGIQYINLDNYQPFLPANEGSFGKFGFSGVMRASAVVFFAYIGFDCLSTASQETRNPQKNMPIGILGSLSICTILYMVFAGVLVGMVNYRLLNVAAPIALAINKTPYIWLNALMELAIIAGLTSAMLVVLMGQTRIFYAMSQDGLLPKVFASIHPRYCTPWLSNIILMLFVSLIGGLAPIQILGNMTSIGTLLAFLLVCAGVWLLRYSHPEYKRAFRAPWVPFTPFMGIVTCLAMMLSLDQDTWIRLFIWLLLGMCIYFSYGRRHSTLN